VEVTENISSSEKCNKDVFFPPRLDAGSLIAQQRDQQLFFYIILSICVSHVICEVAVLKWPEDTKTSILEMTSMLPIPISSGSHPSLPDSLTSENPPTLLRFVFSKLSYLFPRTEVLTAAPRPRPRRCRRRNHSPRRTPPQRGRACRVFLEAEGIRGRCLAHFFQAIFFSAFRFPPILTSMSECVYGHWRVSSYFNTSDAIGIFYKEWGGGYPSAFP